MEEAEDVLGLGLSPGFKFEADDDELAEHFLLRRILGEQLPLEGVIFEDDPLSAPPWELLDKHERWDLAFFFANGQAMHDNGSRRQRRTCDDRDGSWAGQKTIVKGAKLRVPSRGMEVTWRKYMLNFQPQGQNVSTGWVMHEYSITDPVELASSPLRLYRIGFTGQGSGRKREPDDYAQAKAERHLREQQGSAAFPMVDRVDDEDFNEDQDYQHQLVNAMHNWPQQVDYSFQDFAVPNSGEDFGAYAGPGTASAQQYLDEHGSAANSVLEEPAATSYSQQGYQYPLVNGTYDWNQVGSCQNVGVVPSQDAYVGDYAGASSNQYFMAGNLGAHSGTAPASHQGAPGVMNEYDGATPAARMLPFGQGSSSAAIDESFLHPQDINIHDYLVYDQYLEAPLHDQYSSAAMETQW